jgi:putative peptide zinc metalloprotease protein
MMVELVIASLAFFVWLLAEPGIVRAVAYDIILIAGISTLVVNGNPLLRFDGYFILSDLIEIPNLAQRSTRLWGRIATRWLFGLRPEQGEATTLGERIWFVLYGPAAFIYRMLILFSLSLFVATEYFVVGIAIAAVSLVTAIAVPLWRGGKRVLHTAQLQSASRRTQARLLAVAAVTSVLLFVVPVPLHTTSEGIVWLPDDAYVRAAADGFITRVLAHSGSRVDKGASLIASEDAFLATQIELRRQRIRELEVRLVSERFANRVLAEITRAELSEEHSRLRSDIERSNLLTAQSERAGTFVVPEPRDLPGRFHRKGETLGYVLPDQTRTVRGVVLQDDIDLVRHRLRSAQVRLASDLSGSSSARIVREVPAAGNELPSKALAVTGGGAIAVDPKDSKGTKVARRIFQFDLELLEPLASPAFGTRAYVRFEHEPEPVAAQVYRRLRQLFLSRFYA